MFPANDPALDALARGEERLASTYRLVSPPRELASYFLDKERMLEVARAVGVEAPRDYGPAVRATAARTDLAFPVVVKPSVGYRFFPHFGCKLLVARDRAELDRCVARVEATGLRGRVFDLVPGADDSIYAYCTYVGPRGEPLGGMTIRKLRQAPASFGVARVAEVVDDEPTPREATLAILRHIGFRGIACAEFKRDPRDGRFRFFEVNGRSVIYNALLRRAGLDVAALAWTDQVAGAPARCRPNGWRGVWINLHADVLHSLAYGADRPRLGAFLAPYRRPKVHAVWSATDPAPFALEWARTLRAGGAALARGALRARLAEHNPLAR